MDRDENPMRVKRIYPGMTISRKSPGLGILAGVLGGLVGSVALKLFIVAARRAHGDTEGPALDQSGPSHQVAEVAWHGMTGRSLTAK